jgi:hypothetical protein
MGDVFKGDQVDVREDMTIHFGEGMANIGSKNVLMAIWSKCEDQRRRMKSKGESSSGYPYLCGRVSSLSAFLTSLKHVEHGFKCFTDRNKPDPE